MGPLGIAPEEQSKGKKFQNATGCHWRGAGEAGMEFP